MRVRWWAILLALVIEMVVGTLWYGPLFGATWHELQGLDAEALASRGWVHGVSLVINVAKMSCLAFLVGLTGARGFGRGAGLGMLVWIGFVVTIWTGSTLYADRSMTVLAINMGFHFTVLTLAAGLMAHFRKPD